MKFENSFGHNHKNGIVWCFKVGVNQKLNKENFYRKIFTDIQTTTYLLYIISKTVNNKLIYM